MMVDRAAQEVAPTVSKVVSAPAIEVTGVTKTYKVGHTDYPALRGVSFRI